VRRGRRAPPTAGRSKASDPRSCPRLYQPIPAHRLVSLAKKAGAFRRIFAFLEQHPVLPPQPCEFLAFGIGQPFSPTGVDGCLRHPALRGVVGQTRSRQTCAIVSPELQISAAVSALNADANWRRGRRHLLTDSSGAVSPIFTRAPNSANSWWPVAEAQHSPSSSAGPTVHSGACAVILLHPEPNAESTLEAKAHLDAGSDTDHPYA